MDPRRLMQLPRNARYMTAEQMNRLSDNVEGDGALTSTVLIYRDEGEEIPVILSGNHRVQAAIKANLELIWVMEITTRLSKERQTAIALSHNAITGQDDNAILLEMYESISDLDTRAYTGLTDDDLKEFEPLDVVGLGVGGPQYQEISLLFLPDDAAFFAEQVERMAKSNRTEYYVAAYHDFDALFDAIVATKDARNIMNTAVAVRVMAELAMERLGQLESDAEALHNA